MIRFSLFLLTFLFVTTLAVIMGTGSSVVSVHPDAEEWPVKDSEGYYLPFKQGNRWVNWWSRNKPSALGLLWKFTTAKDNSNIPDAEDLDKTLPVSTPYWLKGNESSEIGSPGIRATWIGHATVLAEVDSVLVLTDPIFSQRCSAVQWMGPKRYRPAACTIRQLPDELKAVVISHTHYDHLDYNSVNDLNERFGKKLHWYVPVGLGDWFDDNFLMGKDHVHEMSWWENQTIPKTDVSVVMTPNHHWGRRTAFDENKALWGSWCVMGPKNKFWFGGDTAYADVFKQIGDKLGPFQLSAIPIGAYEPREIMVYSHINPEEAVKVHQDLKSEKSFGIHWATFKLTYEYYLEPKTKLSHAAQNAGLNEEQFQALNIGQTIHG